MVSNMVSNGQAEADREAEAELKRLVASKRPRSRTKLIETTLRDAAARAGVDVAPPRYKIGLDYQQALRHAMRPQGASRLPTFREAAAIGRERSLQQAQNFLAKNWSIVPSLTGFKKPAVKYRHFCKRLATPKDLGAWRSIDSWCGLVIALGPASGPEGYSLAAIDLDTEEASVAWRKQAGDLSDCYCVHTHRGLHVYFLVPTAALCGGYYILYQDGERVGELRLNNVFTMAPGTLHPSSTQDDRIFYHPERDELPNAHDLRRVDDIGAFLGEEIAKGTLAVIGSKPSKSKAAFAETLRKAVQPTRSAFVVETTGRIVAKSGEFPVGEERLCRKGGFAGRSLRNDADIEWWIRQTVPDVPGERDNAIWNASRGVKAFGDYKLVEAETIDDPDFFEDIFARWHEFAAKAGALSGTHDEDDTIEGFWRAMGRVEVPANAGGLMDAMERALTAPDPPCFAEFRRRFPRGFRATNVKALVLLHILQERAWSDTPEPFYISQSKLARFLGIQRQTAGDKLARWYRYGIVTIAKGWFPGNRDYIPSVSAKRHWFVCPCFRR